jgi:hypothetical protein
MVFNPTPTDEQCLDAVKAKASSPTMAAAAASIGITASALKYRVRLAAERGLLGTKPVLPGFRLTQTTAVTNADGDVVREFIQQKPENGEAFSVPAGHLIKGVSALIDSSGNEIVKWVKTKEDAAAQHAAMEAVVAAFTSDLPRANPVILNSRKEYNKDLLNQFTLTDLHFGMLSWREETGEDYDLRIAEQLLTDWFSAAIHMSPDAGTAVLAQLGDMLHHDSHLSVTPTHGHVLDADSRLQKIIRTVIRAMRRIISMLLEKHERVHLIMADANHDPAGGAWLREMFAAFYENEPRLTVDSSASTYYLVEHGETSLFYHHGHRRKIKDVDSVFAGKFREAYGRTKFSYAHMGHLHSDELKSTNLMKVERHETLAAPDAYAANGGWLSGRSAKVITYHSKFGEVGRITLTPDMVRSDG